jgi:phenylalanyl-tRNA synthetase beta chain
LPDQPEHVGLVCGGSVGNPWQRSVELDLFDLKGTIDEIAAQFGVRFTARPAQLPGLAPGLAAELLRGDQVVGFFGQVGSQDDAYPLFVAELALSALADGEVSFLVEAPSRFPGIAADLTLTHSVATPWAEIDRAIAELAPPDLVSWGHKDRYRGPGVAEGAVNTTISFFYNAGDRSLTQDEVNARQLPLGEELERRFGWRG